MRCEKRVPLMYPRKMFLMFAVKSSDWFAKKIVNEMRYDTSFMNWCVCYSLREIQSADLRVGELARSGSIKGFMATSILASYDGSSVSKAQKLGFKIGSLFLTLKLAHHV